MRALAEVLRGLGFKQAAWHRRKSGQAVTVCRDL